MFRKLVILILVLGIVGAAQAVVTNPEGFEGYAPGPWSPTEAVQGWWLDRGDPMEPNILATGSHDGSQALEVNAPDAGDGRGYWYATLPASGTMTFSIDMKMSALGATWGQGRFWIMLQPGLNGGSYSGFIFERNDGSGFRQIQLISDLSPAGVEFPGKTSLTNADYLDTWYTFDIQMDFGAGTMRGRFGPVGGPMNAWSETIPVNTVEAVTGELLALNGTFVMDNLVLTANPTGDRYEKASIISPSNSELVIPAATLEWEAGLFAATHELYLGTDYNEVSDANASVHPGVTYVDVNTAVTYDPDPDMTFNTVYYWRVDEVNGPNTVKGDVWTFTVLDSSTVIGAVNPEPFERYGVTDNWIPTAILDGWNFWDTGSPDQVQKLDPNYGIDGNGLAVIAPDAGNGFGTWSTSDDIIATPLHRLETSFKLVAGGSSGDQCRLIIGNSGQSTWNYNLYAEITPEPAFQKGIRLDGATGEKLLPFGYLIERGIWYDLQIEMNYIADTVRARYAIAGEPFYGWSEAAIMRDDTQYSDIDFVFNGEVHLDELSNGPIFIAYDPSPEDTAENIPENVELSWTKGILAVQHKVYFGTEAGNLLLVTDVTQPQDACSYDPPGDFDLNKTYYWRVDEVNGAYTWTGDEWSFTVASYHVIDDFESYQGGFLLDDKVTVNPDGIRVTWKDGWSLDDDVTDTGSNIYYILDTHCMNGSGGRPDYDIPVHGGEKMMIVDYNNSGSNKLNNLKPDKNCPVYPQTGINGSSYFSKIVRDIPALKQDFASGMVMLNLSFYGDPGNDLEPLSIILKDTDANYAKLLYNSDANDIKLAQWTAWDIFLTDFTAANAALNLNSIERIIILIGDEGAASPGGTGLICFDDIRISPPSCRPDRAKNIGDLNADCVVDNKDVFIMVSDWLLYDSTRSVVLSGVAPTSAPIGHWKLDEAGGTVADDNSVNNNDGQFAGGVTWDPAGGVLNGTAVFDGTEPEGIVIGVDPNFFNNNITNALTLTAWIRTDPEISDGSLILSKGDNTQYGILNFKGSLYFQTLFDGPDGNDIRVDVSGGTIADNQWHHIAGVLNDANNDAAIYIDGDLIARKAIDPGTLALSLNKTPYRLCIGGDEKWALGAWTGMIDDARVYDYGLPADQVMYIATDAPAGVYQSLLSPANIYDSEAKNNKWINLRDFVILADKWLDELLWP